MGSKLSGNFEVLKRREIKFKKTMDFILDNLGENAFHNISKKETLTRFNPVIFDAISNATAIALERESELKVNNIQSRRVNLLNDDNFKLYTSERTTNISSINGRIDLALRYLYGMHNE